MGKGLRLRSQYSDWVRKMVKTPITKFQRLYRHPNLHLIFMLFLILLLSGCARTVTSIISYGTQAEVEVTLRGTMEANNARYFLVVSSSPTYAIPLPYPFNPNYFEFIEPGMTPQPGSGNITDYYTNFYSGWAGYVMAGGTEGVILVPGPFVEGTAATRESIADTAVGGSTIKFLFALDRIFGATIPDTIYFDFVSVDWPTGAAKYSIDHLNSTNAYIPKLSSSKKSVDDEEDPTIDPAMDILNCTVTIQ